MTTDKHTHTHTHAHIFSSYIVGFRSYNHKLPPPKYAVKSFSTTVHLCCCCCYCCYSHNGLFSNIKSFENCATKSSLTAHFLYIYIEAKQNKPKTIHQNPKWFRYIQRCLSFSTNHHGVTRAHHTLTHTSVLYVLLNIQYAHILFGTQRYRNTNTVFPFG